MSALLSAISEICVYWLDRHQIDNWIILKEFFILFYIYILWSICFSILSIFSESCQRAHCACSCLWRAPCRLRSLWAFWTLECLRFWKCWRDRFGTSSEMQASNGDSRERIFQYIDFWFYNKFILFYFFIYLLIIVYHGQSVKRIANEWIVSARMINIVHHGSYENGRFVLIV